MSASSNPPSPSSLEDIKTKLYKIIEPALFNYPDKHYIDKALENLQQHILTEILDIVGEENEMVPFVGQEELVRDYEISIRNQLRAEIRTKAKEKYGSN